MIMLEWRSENQAYLQVQDKEELKKAILWLTEQLAKMEKRGKNAMTVFKVKEEEF